MGLTLDKVHRVVKYKQRCWLKEYIEYNSKQRALATNEFLKSFYKLKNNALFGKTMEDVRKRIKYHLVTDEDKFERYARKTRQDKTRCSFIASQCRRSHYKISEIQYNNKIIRPRRGIEIKQSTIRRRSNKNIMKDST